MYKCSVGTELAVVAAGVLSDHLWIVDQFHLHRVIALLCLYNVNQGGI
jgi:hypothetical protein